MVGRAGRLMVRHVAFLVALPVCAALKLRS